jgi:hypothetical protein
MTSGAGFGGLDLAGEEHEVAKAMLERAGAEFVRAAAPDGAGDAWAGERSALEGKVAVDRLHGVVGRGVSVEAVEAEDRAEIEQVGGHGAEGHAALGCAHDVDAAERCAVLGHAVDNVVHDEIAVDDGGARRAARCRSIGDIVGEGDLGDCDVRRVELGEPREACRELGTGAGEERADRRLVEAGICRLDRWNGEREIGRSGRADAEDGHRLAQCRSGERNGHEQGEGREARFKSHRIIL